MRPKKSHRSCATVGHTRPRHSGSLLKRTALLTALASATLAACGKNEVEPAAAAGPVTQAAAPAPAAAQAAADAPAPPQTPEASAAQAEGTRDPFAGVDAQQVDVLRNIARIDPATAKGLKGATPERPAAPSGAAPALAAAPASTARSAASAAPPPAAAVGSTQGASSAAPPNPSPLTVVPVNAPAPATASPPAPVATPAPAAAAPAVAPALAAVAAPTSSAAQPRSAPRAIAQPRPVFPREALREGYNEGRVLATLAIGADGRVTEVTINSATPSRAFGRAAQQALRDWRYEPAGAPASVQVELTFKLE